jgi:hypothetical protein
MKSLVSDIPAGDGKIVNLFLQCRKLSHPPPASHPLSLAHMALNYSRIVLVVLVYGLLSRVAEISGLGVVDRRTGVSPESNVGPGPVPQDDHLGNPQLVQHSDQAHANILHMKTHVTCNSLVLTENQCSGSGSGLGSRDFPRSLCFM